MQRHLLLFVMLVSVLLVSSQQKVIAIRTANDAVTRIGIEQLQKITFDDTTMRLHLKSGDVNGFPLADIRFFSFETATGLNPTVSSSVNWTVFPTQVKDQLAFKSLPEGVYQVSILSISGQVVHQQQIDNASEVLQLGHLRSGMYVVRINNRALKFSKE